MTYSWELRVKTSERFALHSWASVNPGRFGTYSQASENPGRSGHIVERMWTPNIQDIVKRTRTPNGSGHTVEEAKPRSFGTYSWVSVNPGHLGHTVEWVWTPGGSRHNIVKGTWTPGGSRRRSPASERESCCCRALSGSLSRIMFRRNQRRLSHGWSKTLLTRTYHVYCDKCTLSKAKCYNGLLSHPQIQYERLSFSSDQGKWKSKQSFNCWPAFSCILLDLQLDYACAKT